MSQSFKSIYFPDHPAAAVNRKNVKIAFGVRDAELYKRVERFSSDELRRLIGFDSLMRLKAEAAASGFTLSTFCLRRLRDAASRVSEEGQLYLPGVYVDPIHATFRGGESEPLHLWYPFLEGYSPSFVRQVLDQFAPKARRVFDPFAGTGTTVLTAARLNLDSFYCEVNPLLQNLISIKIKALTMTEKSRRRVLSFLADVGERLTDRLESGPIAEDLAGAYPAAFGASEFFDNETYTKVLRSRALVDEVACSDATSADFLCLAIIASLVPASRLKRAGDLRFKTAKETEKEHMDFETTLREQLARIVSDLCKLEYVEKRPLLVCEDVKNLGAIPAVDADAVITSPPYLNGTNYFRNTKVELWFLRCLRTSADLSSFRFKAVTAGINDVTIAKSGRNDHASVARIVSRLAMDAYDSRIPRMVESYFCEMTQWAQGLKRHLSPGACVAVDIGDSSYGGVHVATDRILVELLQEEGLELRTEVPLRTRLSRDRTRLRQVLLVFDYRRSASRPDRQTESRAFWWPGWTAFKQTLPHQRPPFCKRNWGHPLHSLCSFQGKMKPAIAYHLAKTFLPANATMLDPFAGVGTIPFEAACQGHKSFGFEISPAARVIASAKTGLANRDECLAVVAELSRYLKNGRLSARETDGAANMGFNGKLPDYYHAKTLREILLARRFFQERPARTASACLVLASLLHLLHGNRPYALSRRSHNTTPFAPTGEFEYRELIPRLREKLERSLDADRPAAFAEGSILHQDATGWWPQEISNLDAIITSPPFFDSTRFHLANWLRLWFCGWERADFESKPLAFVDERQKSDLSVYEPIFRQSRERLKPGGLVVLHLGKSRKCNMGEQLARMATRWFRVCDFFSESVRHCESHGVRDKGTVEEHQYLVLS